MTAVSVIIPVYNTERYLKDCIESVLRQTFSDFEVILVDDGSSDNSGQICDYYASIDPRIAVVHQENSGVTKARAVGISRAMGEYIYFVDSDDAISPDALEKMLVYFRDDVDIVIFESSQSLSCSWSEYGAILFRFKYWHLWGKMFRKRLFDEYVLSISRYFVVGEDFLMQLRMLRNIRNRVLICSECKYHYNTNNLHSVQRSSYRSYEYERSMILEVNNIMQNLPKDENLQLYHIKWTIVYLSGMMGLRYNVDYTDGWIKALQDSCKTVRLSLRDYLTLNAIKYPALRGLFYVERRMKTSLRCLIRGLQHSLC